MTTGSTYTAASMTSQSSVTLDADAMINDSATDFNHITTISHMSTAYDGGISDDMGYGSGIIAGKPWVINLIVEYNRNARTFVSLALLLSFVSVLDVTRLNY